MCNRYRNRVPVDELQLEFSQLKIPLRFPTGLPNLPPQEAISITNTAPIVREPDEGGPAELVTMRWSWPSNGGRPVFNYRSEGRHFGRGRCLIIADGFFEFTAPEPGTKAKTRWLFTHTRDPWFAIAGFWRGGLPLPDGPGEAFTMLTCEPGPDVAPIHDRQIVIVERKDWRRWLDGTGPEAKILTPSPAGTLRAERT